jgi:hypothetical protein
MLEEVQGGYLVRLKGEPKIGDATLDTTALKLQKLKQMADFFLGISGNMFGKTLKYGNFVNDEMTRRAEKLEFKPTFCVNNDPKMLAHWLNQAGRQASTLEEVKAQEKEYAAKGRALQITDKGFDKKLSSSALEDAFNQLSRFMRSVPKKLSNNAIRSIHNKLTAAGIMERDDMETVLRKIGVQDYYYKGGGPATAFAWVSFLKKKRKKSTLHCSRDWSRSSTAT